MDTIINDLYVETKKVFFTKYRSIDANNIILTTVHVMLAVEVIPHLKGPEKKNIVLRVVEKIIADSPLDEQSKKVMDVMQTVTMPVLIDVLVDSTRGGIKLNTLSTWIKRHKCSPCARPTCIKK